MEAQNRIFLYMVSLCTKTKEIQVNSTLGNKKKKIPKGIFRVCLKEMIWNRKNIRYTINL